VHTKHLKLYDMLYT